MHHLSAPRSPRLALLLLTAGLMAACLPNRAAAQAAFTVEAGLDGHYRSLEWVPVRVNLTNQGAAARVEVRVRFSTGPEGVQEYRLPERELQSGANQLHTLYVRAPNTYGSGSIIADLYRDGRAINRQTLQLNLVPEGSFLVAGIGPGDSNLKLLTTVQLTANEFAGLPLGGTPPPPGGASGSRISVAVMDPARSPDRWQGFEAANLVVLGNVSERDLTPPQQAALRDWVQAGGTLVVTGGVNSGRLTTPFFADLLPVRVTGTATTADTAALRSFARTAPPTGAAYPYSVVEPKPGARTLAGGAAPMVVEGRKGLGRVLFVAFDPSQPPFRNWDGVREFWKGLLLTPDPPQVLASVSLTENEDSTYRYGQGGSYQRLADAPYAISQLDIPAFYLVALFLLAYIIVLVPVNYYFLKARDKKEYAWLTTPAIVLVFSVGAYLIGYGHKGGRTLVVRTGLMETYAGQDAAASLVYSGLFSPRKAEYEVQPAVVEGGPQGEPPAFLLSEPPTARQQPSLRVVQDDSQRLDGFAVDMWAMRVIKGQGVTRLGGAFEANVIEEPKKFRGTIRNGTRFALDDCYVVSGGTAVRLNELAPGQQVEFDVAKEATPSAPGVIPASVLDAVSGDKEEQRMKRAVLQPLVNNALPAGGGAQRAGRRPFLIGWVKEPVGRLQVNGQEPRDRGATLAVVHLGR